MSWFVVERSFTPKGSGLGEDRFAVVEDELGVSAIVVADGVTDKSGRVYGERTGGALAAECAIAVVRRLGEDAVPDRAVTAITAELAALRRTWGLDDGDPVAPAAVVAVVLPRRRIVWRVGDVHLAIRDGHGHWRHHRGDPPLDRVVAGVRAAYLQCLLAEGHPPDELARDDPGRRLVLPLLEKQARLANDEKAGPFGYGVFDGRPVPARFVEVFSLDGAEEVVVASDGYLSAAETLAAAEERLARSLAADPLRIGDHPATKAVAPGAAGFDDRTYLRVKKLVRQAGEGDG
ncbi:hypothetical protein ACSDR0_26060 [Streptosporangium sp. G11]|uniref:hypothetical protein n=1 Tax=Streptosporangium sp. G11 TaxID=3436926 RepID=UPI003EB85577